MITTEIYHSSVAHGPQFAVEKYQHFDVEPLTGALGAELHGLDIAAELFNSRVQQELKRALTNHLVLVIRDQQLDMDQFRQFGQLFGNLHINPTVKRQGEAGDVMYVRQEADEKYNFAGNWHSDVTWAERPTAETALYAIDVPPWGGDTHFANTNLAFSSLESALQQQLIGMQAVHQLERSQSEFSLKKQNDADANSERASQFVAEHPVVRRHPVTGDCSLFVNEQFTTRFVDMTEVESQPLLQGLFRHQVRPDFTCRIRWKKGSLAIWDNRSTIHYASNDYPNFRREMMRVSTIGEKPITENI